MIFLAHCAVPFSESALGPSVLSTFSRRSALWDN